MKKIVLLCMFALLVVGCSDASASVSNGKEAIVTVGNKKVTKAELYKVLSNQDNGETVVRLMKYYIANKEVTLTADIESEAKEELNRSLSELGENLQVFLDYYGYESQDEYYEKEILPEVLSKHVSDAYIEENWDEVMAYYYPTKVRILETTSVDDANQAKKEIQDGKPFEEVAKKYSTASDELYDGKEHLVSRANSNTLVTNVVTFIRESTGPTLSGIINNDAADRFYVVQITGNNPNQYKEEAIGVVKASEDLETDMISYYCKKYNFKVYDIDLYNTLKENYPTYLQQ